MDFYFAGWPSIAKKCPVLRQYPPKHVLVTAQHILVLGARERRGVMAPPELRTGERLVRKVETELEALQPEQRLLLDSGAYGLMRSSGLVGLGPQEGRRFSSSCINKANALCLWLSDGGLQRFVETYMNELVPMLEERLGPRMEFVEPDVSELAGDNYVRGWRDRIVQSGRIGRCLVVEHSSDPQRLNHVLEWAGDVGAYGFACPDASLSDAGRVGERLYSLGVRHHGLGVANEEVWDVRYSSTDSTRWYAPLTWGRVELWGGRRSGWVASPKSSDQCTDLDSQIWNYQRFAAEVTTYWEGIDAS